MAYRYCLIVLVWSGMLSNKIEIKQLRVNSPTYKSMSAFGSFWLISAIGSSQIAVNGSYRHTPEVIRDDLKVMFDTGSRFSFARGERLRVVFFQGFDTHLAMGKPSTHKIPALLICRWILQLNCFLQALGARRECLINRVHPCHSTPFDFS